MEQARAEGLIPQLVMITTGLMEQLIELGFGLTRDVNAELSQGVAATIDFAESAQRTGFGVVRRVHERVTQLTHVSLGAGESALLALVGSARETGDGAARLASHTASVLMRPSPNAGVN